MGFVPLKRRAPLSTDIAKHLHDSIVGGEFQPGDQLPGQRELAESFGASIASVREAVSVLTAIGLLDVRPGKGTTVVGMTEIESPFDGWLGLADSETSVQDLLEARRLLETYTAARTVEHITAVQVERLKELLDAMHAGIDDLDKYLEADLAFHTYLSELSGNRVLARLMRVIRVPLKWQLRNSNARHLEEHGSLTLNFDTHDRLVRAIVAKDSQAAVSCVNEMVDRATRLLVGGKARN